MNSSNGFTSSGDAACEAASDIHMIGLDWSIALTNSQRGFCGLETILRRWSSTGLLATQYSAQSAQLPEKKTSGEPPLYQLKTWENPEFPPAGQLSGNCGLQAMLMGIQQWPTLLTGRMACGPEIAQRGIVQGHER